MYLTFLLIAAVVVGILFAATGAVLRGRQADRDTPTHCCGCPTHQEPN